MPTDNKILNGSGLTTLVSLIKKDIDVVASTIPSIDALTTTFDDRYVNVDGDTMTGGLTITSTNGLSIQNQGVSTNITPDSIEFNSGSTVYGSVTMTRFDADGHSGLQLESNDSAVELKGVTTPVNTSSDYDNYVATKGYVDEQVGIMGTGIPQNVSDLPNDAGYLTADAATTTLDDRYVLSKFQNFINISQSQTGITTLVSNSLIGGTKHSSISQTNKTVDISADTDNDYGAQIKLSAIDLAAYSEGTELVVKQSEATLNKDPVTSQGIATKGYVDNIVSGITVPVVSATSTLSEGTEIGSVIVNGATTTLYAPTSAEQVYNVDINLDMEYQSGQFINDDSFSSIKQKIEDGVCVVARLYESGNLFQELTVANLSDNSIEFHSPYGSGTSAVTELGVCILTVSDTNTIEYLVRSLNDVYSWEDISDAPDLNALTPYVRKDAVVSTGPTTGTEIATISGVTIYAPAALTPYYMEWNETVNAEEAYAAYEAGRPIYLRGAGYEVPEGDLALTSVTTYNNGENQTAYYFLFEKSLITQQQVYGYDSVSGWTKTISYPVQPSQVNPVAGVTGTAIATIAGKTIYAPVAQGGIQTETDPVFNASVASTITASDISNWNAKSDITPIQSDWAQTTTTSLDYIKNKPILPEYNILSYEGENASAGSGVNFYHILATDVTTGTTHTYQIPAYTPTPTHNNQVTTKSYVDAQIDAVTNTIPTKVSDLTNDSNFIPYGGVTVTLSDSLPTTNLVNIATVDGSPIKLSHDSTKTIQTVTQGGSTISYQFVPLNGATRIVPFYTTTITHDDQVTTKKYVDDKVGELDPYIINYGDEVDMDAVVAAYEAGARIAVHPPYEGPLDQYIDLNYISYGAQNQNRLVFLDDTHLFMWTDSDGWDFLNLYFNNYLTRTSVVPALTTGVVIGSIGGVDIYAPMAGEAPDLSGYVPSTRTVNGKALTTNITLTYSDVGAASTAVATTTTSGLLSSSDKTKLNGIQSGAEVNVQADWSVTTTTSDAFIKNKPTATYDSTNKALVLTGF